MKVLLIGATGNVGSRLACALVAQGCDVVAFVRSEAKLRSLLADDVLARLTVASGDASDAAAIRDALVTHRCDALANTAGLAAIFPWQAPCLPPIMGPVVEGALGASERLGRPVRAWFMGGMGVMDIPGTKKQIRQVFPLYVEHHLTYERLSACPPDKLVWSMLCPAQMVPANSTERKLSPRAPGSAMLAAADSPPEWRAGLIAKAPLVGQLIDVLLKFGSYKITLEDCADFIAADISKGSSSPYANRRVAIMNDPKHKTL